jgi:protein associated with RNAse G/E
MRVTYRKYDGSLHWNQEACWLGEDEHGVWLGAPPNTPSRRGHEPPVVHKQAHVLLFPRDVWWTAVFNAEPRRTEIYCDVTTVPVWRGDEVTMIDLDLDVRRRRDGVVEVLDEDEFDLHRERYGYPDHVVAAARAATEWLRRALCGGTEPFAGGYRRWLAMVTDASPGEETVAEPGHQVNGT